MSREFVCWECQNLISPILAPPPLYCRAYPDGRGIPLAICGGQVDHSELLGDEKEPFVFTLKENGSR